MSASCASQLQLTELRNVLHFAEELLTITDADGAPRILEAVSRLVGADAATLTRVDLRDGHEVVVMWPPERATTDRLDGYAQQGMHHPLRPILAYQANSGATELDAVRISDVLSRRDWRRSALYGTSHRGVDDQMSILTAAHRHIVQAVTLSRSHGNFTDKQVRLLTAGRAHLAAAAHRAGRQPRPLLQLSPRLRWLTARIAPNAGGSLAVTGSGTLNAAVPAATWSTRPTGRQKQILEMVAQGMTDAQIGRRLEISTATVSKHLSRAYSRMGVANRAAAAQRVNCPTNRIPQT